MLHQTTSWRSFALGLTVACSTVIAPSVAAKQSHIPVATFAQDAALSKFQITKDGAYLAFETTVKGARLIVIENIQTQARQAVPISKKSNIEWFRWANNEVLLVSYGKSELVKSGQASNRIKVKGRVKATRLASFDATKSKFKWLSQKVQDDMRQNSRIKGDEQVAQYQDNIVDFMPGSPDHVLQALDIDLNGDNRIRKLNVRTGKYSEYQEQMRGVQHWVMDKANQPRFAHGKHNILGHVAYYRSADTNNWVSTDELDWYQKGYRIIRFTSDPNIAYVSGETKAGTVGLYKMNMETGQIVKEIFANPKASFDHLTFTDVADNHRLPPQGKLTGFTFYDNGPKQAAMTKYANQIQTMVDQSLPDTINHIVTQSRAKKLFIVKAMTPTGAGLFYMLDLNKGSLDAIGNSMPGIPVTSLASAEKISVPMRDGSSITAILTTPVGKEARKLPTVVLPHSGPNQHDKVEFHRMAQFIASRGYLVIQPNYRGSTGRGVSFETAGYNQWGGVMQNDITDTTKWLLSSGHSQAGKVCIMGEKYGGYTAMLDAANNPNMYKCVITIDGILDLESHYTFTKNTKIGGTALVGRMGLKGANLGSVSPLRKASDITASTLIIASNDDPMVQNQQSSKMHGKLKSKGNSQLIVIKDKGLGLDTQKSRTRIMKAVDQFLKENIGR